MNQKWPKCWMVGAILVALVLMPFFKADAIKNALLDVIERA